jgi:hypothetical protein
VIVFNTAIIRLSSQTVSEACYFVELDFTQFWQIGAQQLQRCMTTANRQVGAKNS